MAYERQFFTKGQVLTAEEMNELDAWLAHICGREITAAETNSRGELVFTFRDGGTLNVGEVGGVNAAELTEAVEKALQEAKESGEFDGEPGKPGAPGASGVYVGTGTPTDNAVVWVNPVGEPTATEDWEFDIDDGSTDTKTVVVIGSDDATNQGKVAILRMKDADGNWVEIPAIKGVSPVVKVSKSGKVTTVTITDADGTKTATINDGFDPKVAISKSGKVTTVNITDAEGTKTATINDGVDITKVEQTVTSSEDGGSNVLTITKSNGEKANFTVKNGSKGSPVLVASVSESSADGGTNTVTFTDGKKLNVKNGKAGTSVSVANVSESTADGGENVVTFSDGKTLKVKNGKAGTSVNVAKTTESTESGGSNVVEFSDGKRVTVKNGKDYVLTDTDRNDIATLVRNSMITETWVFTLADGQTVTKAVCVG